MTNRSPEETERRARIRELLQLNGVGSMDDIQQLFKETIAEFMESGLDAELDVQLGCTRCDYRSKKTQQPQRAQQQNPANQLRRGRNRRTVRSQG